MATSSCYVCGPVGGNEVCPSCQGAHELSSVDLQAKAWVAALDAGYSFHNVKAFVEREMRSRLEKSFAEQTAKSLSQSSHYWWPPGYFDACADIVEPIKKQGLFTQEMPRFSSTHIEKLGLFTPSKEPLMQVIVDKSRDAKLGVFEWKWDNLCSEVPLTGPTEPGAAFDIGPCCACVEDDCEDSCDCDLCDQPGDPCCETGHTILLDDTHFGVVDELADFDAVAAREMSRCIQDTLDADERAAARYLAETEDRVILKSLMNEETEPALVPVRNSAAQFTSVSFDMATARTFNGRWFPEAIGHTHASSSMPCHPCTMEGRLQEAPCLCTECQTQKLATSANPQPKETP